jgi:hypothetical protein
MIHKLALIWEAFCFSYGIGHGSDTTDVYSMI